MRAPDRAKRFPEMGHSQERLVEDSKFKPKKKTQAGTVICQRCKAVGMHKKWFVDASVFEQASADPLAYYGLCPGCQRTEDQLYEGEVILEGPVLLNNLNMVYATIYHCAAKAFHENPLSRVCTLEAKGDKIHMFTTTCSLAERLGKAINRAFKGGKLDIKPSPNEKYVIVQWRHE